MTILGEDVLAVLKMNFHRLPITLLEAETVAASGNLRINFMIGEAYFSAFVDSLAIRRAAGDARALVDVVQRPMMELRRILDEAEERGREKERKGILGKLEQRSEALGAFSKLLEVWRRLRRVKRARRREWLRNAPKSPFYEMAKALSAKAKP